MSTRIFIVEDELIHAEALKIAIEEAGFSLAGECNNADEAFELISKEKPDVVLVDISLPGLNNGITLAARINRELHFPHIFVTSFTDEAVINLAVATHPRGYLHKPVDRVSLEAMVKIATEAESLPDSSSAGNQQDSVFARIGNKLVRVNLDDILVIKADGENCISLVTEKSEISCRTTMKEFCSQLNKNFVQVHRSYYINMKHLDSFNERDQTAYIKGRSAPVARGFRKDFLNLLRRV
jgi:DNA-binding LytR/AlgR family response regulator